MVWDGRICIELMTCIVSGGALNSTHSLTHYGQVKIQITMGECLKPNGGLKGHVNSLAYELAATWHCLTLP